MKLDLERVRRNARSATTEELLDRITVYRRDMEPAAIEIIETELDRRGLDETAIAEHHQSRGDVLAAGASVRRCSFCDRPAIQRRWGWHRLWGKLPVFPRVFNYCATHRK